MQIDFNAAVIYPGEPVTLSIYSEPGSLCMISVVDESVKLLRQSGDAANHITEKKVDKIPYISTIQIHRVDFIYIFISSSLFGFQIQGTTRSRLRKSINTRRQCGDNDDSKYLADTLQAFQVCLQPRYS